MNNAIIDTYACGSVSSTTLMVNAAATEDAVKKAMEQPGLGVGLHFNLTLGRPVSDPGTVKTLVDASGNFFSRGELARRMLLRRAQRAEIQLELQAQYARMRSLGLRPSHIDSHQHIHAFPSCFDAVAHLCKGEKIPMRMPWILNPGRVTVPVSRKARQWLLQGMLERNRKHWDGRVRWNAGLGSIFDLGTTREDLHLVHYRKLLECAPPGVFELMVHPARDAEQLTGLTSIGSISEREWRFLTSNQLPTLISELGFTLGNYRDI